MHCILIGQSAILPRSALSDEDGAGAGTRTRTSSMACSCAAVEHHARSCSRAAALDVQADNNLRAGGSPQPGTLAIHVVKELPLSRHPASVEVGGTAKARTQNKTPGGLASIRAFMTPKGLDREGAA